METVEDLMEVLVQWAMLEVVPLVVIFTIVATALESILLNQEPFFYCSLLYDLFYSYMNSGQFNLTLSHILFCYLSYCSLVFS